MWHNCRSHCVRPAKEPDLLIVFVHVSECNNNNIYVCMCIAWKTLTAAIKILKRAHKSFVLRDMANRSCSAPS